MADSKPTLQVVNPDPFNLESLRLDPSTLGTAGVGKMLTTVPVRRPHPQDWVRVHPSQDYRENFPVITLKEDREDYIVLGPVREDLKDEMVAKTLFTAINRQGVLFLWPVRFPKDSRRKDNWARSDREAAEMAMARWIRVKADMSLGAYQMFKAESAIADPVWPELTFEELLRLAFRDNLVDSLDHPVIRQLRGG